MHIFFRYFLNFDPLPPTGNNPVGVVRSITREVSFRIFAEFQGGILVRLVFFLIIVFVLRMLMYVRVKATAITTFPTTRWYAETSPSTRDINRKNFRRKMGREGEAAKRRYGPNLPWISCWLEERKMEAS